MRAPALLLVLALLPACGASLPPRFVLEREIDEWSYRRFQETLDVEFPIEGNPARGYTATYIRRAVTPIPYVNVFVTVYERPTGLAAEVRRQLRGLETYDREVVDRGGGRHWSMRSYDEVWAVWVSRNHVVKLGARPQDLDEIPEAILGAYFDLYPSDLDEFGRARAGTLSAGEVGEDDGTPSQEEDAPPVLPEGVRGADETPRDDAVEIEE